MFYNNFVATVLYTTFYHMYSCVFDLIMNSFHSLQHNNVHMGYTMPIFE